MLLLFYVAGFTVLFCAMVPVPRPVKIGFHVFGLGAFILGVILCVYTYWASEDCVSSYAVANPFHSDELSRT